MRLYHSAFGVIWLILLLTGLLSTSCTAPQVTQGDIDVLVNADGVEKSIRVPSGSTVQQVIDNAGITLSALDRVEPASYTVISDGSEVRIIRVDEEFFVKEVIIPFERQVVRNESMPAGESRLSQPGVNGVQENTYRRLLENGVEVANSLVKSVTVQEAVPEIMMMGSQSPFAAVAIPGKLAYLSNGNAWVMEGTTANRKPVITTGDLDGQIFSLSQDGSWLLFSRHADDDKNINTLWAAKIDDDPIELIDLQVANIVHFADWNPALSVVGFSTVEPRSTPPGWQANNDLYTAGVSDSGFTTEPRPELEPNAGGIYGWWGMDFTWFPDGLRLAYTRPDGVGIFDPRDDQLQVVRETIPLQTGSDWAWAPGVSLGPDGKVLYMVDHVPSPGSAIPEESSLFDLVAIPLEAGFPVTLASDVGMFAYPAASPVYDSASADPAFNGDYQVAFLQAIFPNQSDSSRYQLIVIDRDGSNRRVLFPGEGAPGLEPQHVNWSPERVNDEGKSILIAILYQGNLWFVDAEDGSAQQITGDGQTSRIDWK